MQDEEETTKHIKKAGRAQKTSGKTLTKPADTKLAGPNSPTKQRVNSGHTQQHQHVMNPDLNITQNMQNVITLGDKSVQNKLVKETEPTNTYTLTLSEALKDQMENIRHETTQLFELDEQDVVGLLPADSVGLLKTSGQHLHIYGAGSQDPVVIQRSVKVEAIPQTGDMQ